MPLDAVDHVLKLAIVNISAIVDDYTHIALQRNARLGEPGGLVVGTGRISILLRRTWALSSPMCFVLAAFPICIGSNGPD
jgi:hypothetical protein